MKRKKALLLSCLVWGSGQFFVCKQRIKGLLFFMMQAILIAIELLSGYWIEYLLGYIKNFQIRLHGGFFTKGIWGLITLGEKVGVKNGDHSTLLLINGIISVILIFIFAVIYFLNAKDAYETGKKIDETGIYISSKDYGKKIFEKKFPYIILSPIAVAFIFVVVMPIIFSILTAFLNYNRDHLPPGNLIDWVGFDNFIKLFRVPVWSNTFFHVLIWTIVWAFTATFSTYFLGMLQAIILNHKSIKFKKFFRTVLILPWAIPQIISLMVFRNLLNGQFGPINQFLLDIGLISERIPFLTDPIIAKITVIVVNLWLGFPMFMVMMLGVFANLDESLYEAAAIDGASKFQIFKHITLPLVMLATAPPLVMNLASNFNNFGSIYFLTQGGPANTSYQFAGDTDILISWIYKLTLDQQMYNMAAVMSVLIFIIIGGFSFWQFKNTTSFKEV
ncbi:sugar ABC transporter permease [Clostridium sp. D46t1_190503_E9]|uniref:carbohydrate ABC transporter permease n=2 Tax=unclassified Clostridium TaxID=2614128 RepID=UPI00189A57DA|nr:sugar ABC transporter permease [Clostridium sp. D46t1_190503_E9]